MRSQLVLPGLGPKKSWRTRRSGRSGREVVDANHGFFFTLQNQTDGSQAGEERPEKRRRERGASSAGGF